MKPIYKILDWIPLHRIKWMWLSENPNIFELDKDAMRKQIQPLAEELASVLFHPLRVERILNKYNYNIVAEEYWRDWGS